MAVGIGNDIVIGRRQGVRLSGGGASFVGPYDAIPSITAAYGMRRLLSSYTTNKLLRLRRSSDNAESDFGWGDNADGSLDAAAIATWLGGNSGYITTWYEQKNGYNATQAAAASQPLYVASGQNSKPVAKGDGVNDWLAPGSSHAVGAMLAVFEGNTASGYLIDMRIGIVAYMINESGGVGGWSSVFANGESVTINASMYLTIFGSSYRVVTGNLTTPGNASPVLLSRHTSSQFGAYNLAEIVYFSVNLSTENRQAAESAANAYWSVY